MREMSPLLRFSPPPPPENHQVQLGRSATPAKRYSALAVPSASNSAARYAAASRSLAVSVPSPTLMASASGRAGGTAAVPARRALAAPRPVAPAAVAVAGVAAAALKTLKTGWCWERASVRRHSILHWLGRQARLLTGNLPTDVDLGMSHVASQLHPAARTCCAMGAFALANLRLRVVSLVKPVHQVNCPMVCRLRRQLSKRIGSAVSVPTSDCFR